MGMINPVTLNSKMELIAGSDYLLLRNLVGKKLIVISILKTLPFLRKKE
ncbi:MAG: hypothetical protein ACXACO_08140 [Promethearchaeota archaeon]